jgi:VanZ family protein
LRTSSPAPGRRAQRFFAWAPVVFLLGLEFWLSSQSNLPRVLPAAIPHGDKFLHAGYFALTALFAARALRQAEGWGRGATAAALLSGALLWGASDEFHQSFVPGRSVEAADVAADVLGAGLAALVAVRLFANRPDAP